MKILHQTISVRLYALWTVLFLAAPAFADYTVRGRFEYEDREFSLNGFTGTVTARPIRFAGVRIVAGNTTLVTGATNASGEFSITVPGSLTQPISAVCVATSTATPGPLVDVRVANNDFSFGDLYSVSSASVNSPGAGVVDLGTTLATASTDIGKAFNIWDVIHDGLEFLASSHANGRVPTTRLTVLWRQTHNATTSFYSRSGKTIFVGANTSYDDTIISHEFGHFIDDLFSRSDSPGGQHFLGDGNQDIRLSWGEGLATFLGSSIRSFKGYSRPDIYVNTDGTNLSFSFELESLNGNVTLGSKTGSTNEVAVSAALWDITDGAGTNDGTNGSDDDPLERPFEEVWKALTQYLPTIRLPGISIEDFWDGWFSAAVNNGFLPQMQTVFGSLNGMEFYADAQEPDNTASAASTITAALIPSLSSVHNRETSRYFGKMFSDWVLGEAQPAPNVLITELDLGTIDAVELYNAGSAEAELSGWKVVCSRPGFATATFVLPAFKLRAGAFVILSEASGTNSNTTLFFGNNVSWANGEQGACALMDSTGLGKDFVRWGNSVEVSPNGTPFSGANPGAPPTGRNLARNFSARDTDTGSDWNEQNPTLGTFGFSGHERHHTYYGSGDVDFVAFNATAGRSYYFETLSLQSGADTILDILSSDGIAVLSVNDDFALGKASRMVWTALASGKFSVRSRRFDGLSNFAQYGSYDFRIIESTSPIGIAAPEILTVSKGSQGARFQTLSEAVAAASTGDTIQILDSSTYVEPTTITGKSITLRAASGKNPVVDGSGSSALATLNLSNAKNVEIEGLTIVGGQRGIRVSGGAATIVNTVIHGSSDPARFSDGVQIVGYGASAAIVNCTIVNNGRIGVGLFNSGSARIANSILKDNAAGDVAGDGTSLSLVVKNSLIGSGGFAGANGNINGNPQFVNPVTGDFRLKASSPAIDAADGADPALPPIDGDGIPRIIDGDRNGSALPDMGAFEYLPSGSLTSVSVFPQVAAGGSFKTSVIAVNTRAVPATASLGFSRSDGSPLTLKISNRTAASFNFSIPPAGVTRLETTGTANTLAGYATLLSNVPVNGSALFKTMNGDTILSEAGVGLSRPTKKFTVYVDNKNDALSGYAVANFGASTAILTLRLRDNNGTTREIQSIVLPAWQHVAEFAIQRFPANAPAGFEGTIEFTSDQDVSAVALRFDNPGQDVFSTIPVLADEASTTLFFPQVADGGGYRTNFILLNTTDTPTMVRLDFFASDGSPLNLPVEGTSKSSHSVAVSAGGVTRFTTDGTSSGIRVGWVRVTSPVAIGGSSIFQTLAGRRITSEAGAASSPAATHFTAYVESLGFAESGIALSNPNSVSVTVTLNLRNSAGNVVSTTAFDLPPLGHVARFFTEWFPRGFEEFEGTLEVRATGGVSGVALRYDNFLADVFATLPVIR